MHSGDKSEICRRLGRGIRRETRGGRNDQEKTRPLQESRGKKIHEEGATADSRGAAQLGSILGRRALTNSRLLAYNQPDRGALLSRLGWRPLCKKNGAIPSEGERSALR